jgi:hypothetical protein
MYALFLRHLAHGVTPSTYFCRPSWVLHVFPTGCKVSFHDFYKFPLAGKNLRTIDFIKVEYYVTRGDTLFIYLFTFMYLTFMGPRNVIIF